MKRQRFPIYIPTKGRADTGLTSKALARMGVHHRLVVERQEIEAYEAAGLPGELLELDPAYQRDYDTCDDLGDTKSKGPGPARNFIWEHAIAEGHEWHWVMDDNIQTFYRFHQNGIVKCETPAFWESMEAFVLRYENIGMAGPNYEMFVPRRTSVPPFVMNTRIYSCNLIRNDLRFRWRGRYNEDTILSLDLLKAGWCTVQFNAFLQKKIRTQMIGGGNTDEFYDKEGTLPKSRMQVAVHPDVSTLVWKFGRWHHHVDYRPFRNMSLRRKGTIPASPDNRGMILVRKDL